MPSQTVCRLLCLVLLSVPTFARAQTVDRDQFRKFLSSKANRDLVVDAVAGLPSAVFHTCPGFTASGVSVVVESDITFGADGIPNAGSWWEHLPVSGCGPDMVLNVHFTAGEGGRISTVVGQPGTTRTDLRLQPDAAQYALMAAGSKLQDCKQFYVKNTQFRDYGMRDPMSPDPGPHAQFRPWWETWTIVGCNRSFDVMLEFVPTSKGTSIIQPRSEIIEY
jgi:hypothetical protein